MNSANSPLGKPLDRVDGPLKVTGKACYAAEAEVPGLLYGAVVSSRIARGRVTRIDAAAAEADAQTAEFLSELRLVKDAWEVERMRASVAATIAGFEDVVRALPHAIAKPRGERLVEGAFFARARAEGNDLGYDTIAASGNNATVLHWIRNTGTVRPGELLLLDAGVEDDSPFPT